jgi:small GTP-binding protein
MGELELVRLIVIGDSTVGKTQMMFRFTDDTFHAEGVGTVGVDFRSKTMQIGGVPHKVQIWDTAGQERFRNITEAYYRKGHGIAIVYDISRPDTFQTVPGWFESVKSKCEGAEDIPVVLIGNKADLEAKVSVEEGQAIATKYGAHFFQTSAKDGSNIDDAFTDLATQAAEYNARKRQNVGVASGLDIGVQESHDKPKKTGFSC